MKYLSSKQIRELWLNFFQANDHLILPSASLVPQNDPSLLLINSGVATLKDYFSNKKLPPAKSLVNSQKCIRTNDIENVGLTARHLTFFEMLGNFSIGGYFKQEAIKLAYEFIFQVLKLELSKVYITYHENDEITYFEWLKLGIEPSHLIKGDNATNFWDVGRGPCGYCTEIFYDRGLKYDPKNQGIKLLEEDIDNDRYLEIWNIVFSEFNNDGNDNYIELKSKNIDTGAGLERIVSLFQDAPTNFETDLFLPIIHTIETLTSFKYDLNNYFSSNKEQTNINRLFKVIADHLRAVVMAIQDGVKPSNTARGYVIRKLIRRAYHSGTKLKINAKTFLYQLVDVVSQTLPIYPIDINKVKTTIKQEEEIFANTIKQGEELLLKTIKNHAVISSEVAFRLFETYGFPIELTTEIAKTHNIKLDLSNFEQLKFEHIEVSRKNLQAGMDVQLQVIQEVKTQVSQFVGYDNLSSESTIIFQGRENNQTYVIFDKTPFYATSGGQQFDQGLINNEPVLNVFKDQYLNHWHVLKNRVKTGLVELNVNENYRLKAMKNHSATHLLGKAIYDVLGYTTQLGSENNDQKLRLDFPADQKPSIEQIDAIENRVNQLINQGLKREYIITTKRQALEMGAWILEKEVEAHTFENEVRVVNFENVSIEFCGGTHVNNTSKIEQFKIIKVESKGSGTYRIEALTSFATIKEYETKELAIALETFNKLKQKNQALNKEYNLNPILTLSGIKTSLEQVKNDYKSLLNTQQAEPINLNELEIQFTEYHAMPTYINLTLKTVSQARQLAVLLREQYFDKLFILGVKKNDKQTIIVSSKTYDSNQVLQTILKRFNGKGGGQTIFAMGQADLIENL